MASVSFPSLLARDQNGIRFHVWREYLGLLKEGAGYQAMIEGSSLLIWPCKEAAKGCHKGGCYNVELPGEAIEEYGRGLTFSMRELSWPLFAPTEHKFELHDDGSITTELEAPHTCKWPYLTRASRKDQIMDVLRQRIQSCIKAGVAWSDVMRALAMPDNFRQHVVPADWNKIIQELTTANRIAA